MSSSVSGNMKGFYKQKKNTNLTTTAKSSKSIKPPTHASTSPSLNTNPDLQGSIWFLGFSHPQSPSSFINFIYFIFLIWFGCGYYRWTQRQRGCASTIWHEHEVWALYGDDEAGTLGACCEAWFEPSGGNRGTLEEW